ncbi:hypothetical protein J2736_006761 [Paenibacillus qinlingensis]|uniref:Uncharacterized protein n=1 Tax=Paenibacillus qinlingensis TaxID=1837343 RepID=A0ABU1P7G2_9BACL|nr:hypothetical protein [Paenibacillus qinlingensis]
MLKANEISLIIEQITKRLGQDIEAWYEVITRQLH